MVEDTTEAVADCELRLVRLLEGPQGAAPAGASRQPRAAGGTEDRDPAGGVREADRDGATGGGGGNERVVVPPALRGDHVAVAVAVPEALAIAGGAAAYVKRGDEREPGGVRGRLLERAQFTREYRRMFGAPPLWDLATGSGGAGPVMPEGRAYEMTGQGKSPCLWNRSISTRLTLNLKSSVSRTVSKARRSGQSSKASTSPSWAMGCHVSGRTTS